MLIDTSITSIIETHLILNENIAQYLKKTKFLAEAKTLELVFIWRCCCFFYGQNIICGTWQCVFCSFLNSCSLIPAAKRAKCIYIYIFSLAKFQFPIIWPAVVRWYKHQRINENWVFRHRIASHHMSQCNCYDSPCVPDVHVCVLKRYVYMSRPPVRKYFPSWNVFRVVVSAFAPRMECNVKCMFFLSFILVLSKYKLFQTTLRLYQFLTENVGRFDLTIKPIFMRVQYDACLHRNLSIISTKKCAS